MDGRALAARIREELDLSPDDVVISFVGQIRDIKGIDVFIRMAHAISAPSAKFLIVGECRDPDRFPGSYTEKRLRSEMGNDTRIKYVGYRSDVENVYRASDIVVMPSRGGEPFGLVTIEAGASHRPVVATRDGGMPEVIVHGENGFLIERDDLAALVNCTTLLIDNRELRQRMGERARQIVVASPCSGHGFKFAPVVGRDIARLQSAIPKNRSAGSGRNTKMNAVGLPRAEDGLRVTVRARPASIRASRRPRS